MMVYGNITLGRMTPDGVLKPQHKNSGIKWALIAAVAVLGTTILGLSTVASATLGILTITSGFGVLAGILPLGSSVITALMTISLARMSFECIKNAHHHLKKPTYSRLPL